MKILVIADALTGQNAGVHTYCKQLLKTLQENDHTNQYIIHNLKTLPDKKIPFYGSYRKFFKIPHLAKKLQVNAVWYPSHLGPFNLPKNIKRIITIHDLTPIITPQYHTLKSRLIQKLFLPHLLSKADLILTPSQQTKTDIQKFQSTKAQIIVTPLATNHPPQIHLSPQNLQEKIKNIIIHGHTNPITQQTKAKQSKTQKPYLLYLGTIEPRKNLITLITAFTELNIPDHQLILAGKIGWKAKSIIKLAKQHHNITLTGKISENKKQKLIENAKIFIYPSYYEGFGLPVLESLSHGIPTITTNTSSLKEYFQDHTLQFSPDHKTQLKQHINTLLQNPKLYQKLSKEGQIYSKKFTWQSTANLTASAINALNPPQQTKPNQP